MAEYKIEMCGDDIYRIYRTKSFLGIRYKDHKIPISWNECVDIEFIGGPDATEIRMNQFRFYDDALWIRDNFLNEDKK